MEMRQLEFFLAVVETGSVTAAARDLHITQPSLSQSLRRLEREVGAVLFQRVGRGMVITSAGEALVGPARRILKERLDARAAVAAVAGLGGGELVLGALPSLTLDPLAPILGRFRRAYPLVRITVRALVRAESVVDAVSGGACDLGIVGAPVHDPELTRLRFGTQRLVLLAHRDVPLPDGPLGHDDLVGLPFVCGPAGGSSRIALENALRDIGAEPHIVVETESTEAIVPLVLNGCGVALLPEGLVKGAERSAASVRELDPPLARETLLLHRSPLSSPAARAFIDLGLGRTPDPQGEVRPVTSRDARSCAPR
ncbi:LysR substrate-binding domain-containing protein [Pseudonocardia ailaonensis]|uniref:LysR substrate-binding domain-containing protein n=1 Tax=Pseudonocardia ailaonensis TaxID=367279 RepID=A0ABN2MIH6_9PSEU